MYPGTSDRGLFILILIVWNAFAKHYFEHSFLCGRGDLTAIIVIIPLNKYFGKEPRERTFNKSVLNGVLITTIQEFVICLISKMNSSFLVITIIWISFKWNSFSLLSPQTSLDYLTILVYESLFIERFSLRFDHGCLSSWLKECLNCINHLCGPVTAERWR